MKLIIFDVDGTLVDSQDVICAAMTRGFARAGHPVPDRDQILSIVGLSLPIAVARLAPDVSPADHAQIVEGYREAFFELRQSAVPPLYEGALACLDRLKQRDDWLLAIATGKSRRGLDAMIAAHGLEGRFISLQTADDNPSKPDPSMLLRIMAETGMEPVDSVMVGDTSFDMDMARAAGMVGFGVSWGYHSRDLLTRSGAALVARDFDELTRSLIEWAA